jgi:hypothetical protein
MYGMSYSVALIAVSNTMREHLDGAVTTGIVPEQQRRPLPAASPDAPDSRGSFLTRAWRFVFRSAARPKAACSTC